MHIKKHSFKHSFFLHSKDFAAPRPPTHLPTANILGFFAGVEKLKFLLPPPLHCCAATAAAAATAPPPSITLSHCRHHRCCRVAATALLPLHCAPLPLLCRRQAAAAKLQPPVRCRAAAIATAAAAAPSFIGWLLRCCPPSNFVITCRPGTVNALVAGRFCRTLSTTAATTAAAKPPL